MTAEHATAAVDEELVGAVIDHVWESLLNSPATPWLGPEPAFENTVRAEIPLHGDWNGLIRLTCDAGTAEGIAGLMLSLGAGETLDTEDVHDAVGEVVNVVGGNFKGGLRGVSALGLPVVVDAPDGDIDEFVVGTRCLVEWRGAPVVVEVLVHPTPEIVSSAS